MAKWTVTLTVIASCIFGVISQSDFSSSPTFAETPENNTQFSSALNVTDTMGKMDGSEMRIEFNSTSFPPLIHDINSQEASTPTSAPVTSATTITTKATVTHKEVRVFTEGHPMNENKPGVHTNHSTTTEKPNSSNISRGSLIAITVGVLVCKFGFYCGLIPY